MSCLLCLRNEGIHLPNESHNDLEILLNLFKLSKDFSETLQGNQCCSICRVKLQFVEVINQEMLILSQKLKCFEEEVKEIFVSSFNENDEPIKPHETSSQARVNLLKELNIKVVGIEETRQVVVEVESDFDEFEGEGIPVETQVSNLDSEAPWQPELNYQNENYEISVSKPFAAQEYIGEANEVFNEENEIFISPKTEIYIVEDGEGPNDQNSFHDSNFESPHSFDTAQLSSTQSSSASLKNSSTAGPSKPEKNQKRKKVAKLPNMKGNSGKKLRITFCTICEKAEGVRIEFEREIDYEGHLKIVHPTRDISKCTICNRIIPEDNFGSSKRLTIHMRQVHTPASFKCDQCGASFKTSYRLKAHSEIHLKNREIFICEHCDATITGERNFKQHIKRQHPEIDC